MKSLLATFLVLLSITLVLVGLFFFIIYKGIYAPKDADSKQEMFFSIEKGQGVEEIAENLEEQGLIRDKWFFVIYVLWREIAINLKAGDYLLSPSMNVSQIAEKFFIGDIARQKIVVFEGWNLRDIADLFEEREMFAREEFFEIAGYPATNLNPSGLPFSEDFNEEFDFLSDKPRNISLEGYLFPDTYEVYKEDRVKDVIKKMLVNFGEKLTPELKDEIESQGKTIFEVVIMASLLEKEVASLKDKKIVAGILWKRLGKGMPLQVDATVNYALDQSKRAVSLSDTETDSLYNTYKYKGLPLGPISNPGIDSIEAAIYPTETPYFYYLSAKSGETIFSQTFEQHKAAKAKYLK